MNYKLVLTIICTLIISGCASNKPKVNINDPNQVAQNIEIVVDKFKKTTTYWGVNIGKSGNGIENIYLRATRTENGITYSIYLDDNYDNPWRNYESAYDSNGKELNVIKIDKKIRFCIQDKCRLEEQLAVLVRKQYLEENIGSGISIKITGKRGEEIFFLPGGYIEGFLRAVK